MFRFGDSLWLIGLLSIPALVALAWFAARRRARALDLFGESELVRKLTASVHLPARRVKVAVQVVAVGFLVLALSRPQFGTRIETVRSVGQDIMIAVDLSQSMLAEDISPNRLERARLAILRLMSRMDGDRIGLVAFAGDAFVQSPLTVDYSAAAMFLSAMHPEIMPVQGTDLGAALRVSLDALIEAGRESRVLVVITDGEDHETTFDAELSRAVENGVRLYFVGIGSPEGVPIPVFDEQGNRQGFLRDDENNVVTTKLDVQTLQAAAERSGGTFISSGPGSAAFEDLIDEIARVEGESVDERQITQFEEQYQIFLGLALALLFLEWLVSDRRRGQAEWAGRFE